MVIKELPQIMSSTSFNIRLDTPLLLESYNTGQVTINTRTFDIQTILNASSNTILVTTFTEHNYTTTDIGTNVTLYSTTTTPNLDETYTIYNVFDAHLLYQVQFQMVVSVRLVDHLGYQEQTDTYLKINHY